MLRHFRHTWRQFRSDPPGQRFQADYRRTRRSRHGNDFWHHVLRIATAAVALAIAAVLMFTPIPGMPLLVAIAAALLAPESLHLARFLDQSELTLRAIKRVLVHRWRTSPTSAKVVAVPLTVAAAAACAYGLWLLWKGKGR